MAETDVGSGIFLERERDFHRAGTGFGSGNRERDYLERERESGAGLFRAGAGIGSGNRERESGVFY